MSAIQSLLRVMTLRDAEAIVLEAGKVPSLRRRGQVEALAMPPLEAQLLADFAAPLVEGRTVDEWPAIVPFAVDDASYQVTIEKVPAGLRVVVRKGKPVAPRPALAAAPAAVASDTASRAWWASPAAGTSAPAAGASAPDRDSTRFSPPLSPFGKGGSRGIRSEEFGTCWRGTFPPLAKGD